MLQSAHRACEAFSGDLVTHIDEKGNAHFVVNLLEPLNPRSRKLLSRYAKAYMAHCGWTVRNFRHQRWCFRFTLPSETKGDSAACRKTCAGESAASDLEQTHEL